MSSLLQDLRYSMRSFGRSPAFSLVAILTLALGLGATVGVYSVIDGVLLRPLPYPEAERLVYIGTYFDHDDQELSVVSPGNLVDLAAQATTLEAVTGSNDASFTVLGDGDPEIIEGVAVERHFFSLFGIEPVLGRGLTESDYEADAADVVVLTHGLWQERWAGDPTIVGRTITLNRRAYTVVGVGPEDYYPPEAVYGHDEARMWVPLKFSGEPGRSNFGYQAIARLAPDATISAASAEVDRIFRAQTEAYNLEFEVGGGVEPLVERTLGTAEEPLLLLLGAVGLLLLIACANVSNLMLARGTKRAQELAVRRSLGASRARIVRQLLTESSVLAIAGGIAGVMLSRWLVQGFKAISPGGVPRLSEVEVDMRVFATALVLSAGVGLLFGLAPALQAFRLDASEGLLRSAGSRGIALGSRMRGGLVVVEIALAMVLLVGAALLLNSFVRMGSVDPGFEPEGMVAMRVNLRNAYPDRDTWRPFFQDVLAHAEAAPGVVSASLTTSLPFGGVGIMSSVTPLDVAGGEAEEEFRPSTYVSDGHFRNIGMTLLQGEGFGPLIEGAAPQVIVNTALARAYWPEASSAVGKRIVIGSDPDEDPIAVVVGVVSSLRFGYDQDEMPEMYFPAALDAWRSMWVVARTDGDIPQLANSLRAAVWAVDADLPIDRVATVSDLAWSSIGRPRFYSALAGILAVVALTLSLVGIYGTISYTVGCRVQELGIRIALGARPNEVVSMVLGGGLKLALAGVALGTIGAWGAARFLESFLFGITATDVPTFALTALLFVGTALVACWIPARRAALLDPVNALRQGS